MASARPLLHSSWRAGSCDHQGLQETVRSVAGRIQRLGESVERKGVGVERIGIQPPGGNRGDRLAHSLDIDGGIALVRVDDVQPSPVPELHVDLARTVLMVPGDY